MRLAIKFLFSILFGLSSNVMAAACCGGGAAMPSLILGDDKALVSSYFGYSRSFIENVDNQGLWRQSDSHQLVQTIKFEGSILITDRWQLGLSLPFMERTKNDMSINRMGDVTTSIGFEFLPDWDYNPYRPKGILVSQFIIPTGKTRFESEQGGLDIMGNGYYGLGVGFVFSKSWTMWDVLINCNIQKMKEKNISSEGKVGTLIPGDTVSYGVGVGYNFKQYRIGSAIQWIEVESTQLHSIDSDSLASLKERWATGTVSFSYLVDKDWTLNMSYSDQTLFGDPLNTSLAKGFSIQAQKSWSR